MAEFSDVPLRLPSEATTYHGFFPARYVTDYLENYADSHIYCGKSLRDRILCQHRVTRLERRVSGEWSVLTSTDSEQRFEASKLIVASGFTSTPYEPTLPSRPAFSGQILHQKFFGQSSFLNNPQVANVAVLGGGKSAADIVYASAKAGKHVSWIIREGGGGPAAHTQAAGLGPYENSIEMFGTRVLSSLSPSIFGSQTIWTRILHRTRVGRKIVDWVWKKSDKQNRSIAGYQTRRGAGKGFEELEPDTS
jgi:dimethylaniline monooxygenase (N-oxide forming)